MKTFKEFLVEGSMDDMGKLLKKYGVKSPGALKGKDKTEFWTELRALYESEDVNEGMGNEDMLDSLEGAIGSSDKFDQALWDWFMDNMGDSDIYAGDAVPEDYLEIMDKNQVKACHKDMSKKFKGSL